MGSEHCRQLLYDAAAESDLILVEGVMGLFDGEPSSADLAEQFGLPILPVIYASAMAQTFAAVLHGLATFRSSLKFAGAVANRVASTWHAELLQTGLPAGLQLASLLHNSQANLPGRHLGLQLASEIADIIQRLDYLADAIGETWLANLPPVIAFAKPECSPKPELLLQGKTIAVARDQAFCFLYQQNLDCLREMGAQLIFFSPLSDTLLPAADGVYLPGGYPELYADILSANSALRIDIQAHVKPLLAECGGMMYLTEALLDIEGDRHEMLGVMPGMASMQPKLSAIGSQQAELNGQIIRGHTFHYSTLQTAQPVLAQAQAADGRSGEAVYQSGSVTASYLHFYFPSNPEAIVKLLLSANRQVQTPPAA
ncbi:MAG: cobyrinate a,c-diamide synthase [Methylococcales bacterium]|nr:cobyrinate a,c-diamide synthase [Methylococcales bacterium]